MPPGTSVESATRVVILLTLAAVNVAVATALFAYGSRYEDFLAANMEGNYLPDTVRLSLVWTRNHYILYLAFASLITSFLVSRLHYRSPVSKGFRDAAITLIAIATLGMVGITITGILRAGVELHMQQEEKIGRTSGSSVFLTRGTPLAGQESRRGSESAEP